MLLYFVEDPPVFNTFIRFVWVSAKFGICTVVGVNETLVEAKMCKFTLESTHIIVNKCTIYKQDSASAKFRTNSHETDYSEVNAGVDKIKDNAFPSFITNTYNYQNYFQ